MKISYLEFWAATTFIAVFPNISCQAADSAMSIPRIEGQPALADFSDMRPRTSLARSMNKAENFIQREPYPGEASAQRTEHTLVMMTRTSM